MGMIFFPYKYNDFIMLCKYSTSSNIFAANVDKMGTSVPKLRCTVLYTLTHLITATTWVQNAVKCRRFCSEYTPIMKISKIK